AKFIDWYNEFAGEEGTDRKDTSSKPDDKKQTWSKNKQFRKQGGQKQVNAISIKAESDSESDDVMYQPKVNRSNSAYPVSALYSDASESENESDEIIIDAKIGGKPVLMLFDPCAKKNLLPAKQFKSPKMVPFSHRSHHQQLGPKEVQNGGERLYDPNQGLCQRQRSIYSGPPIHKEVLRQNGRTEH